MEKEKQQRNMKQKKNKKNNSNSEKERRDGQLTHFTLLFSQLFSLGRFCCCLLCCCYSSCCCLSCYWACCKLSWAWALALFVSRRRSKVERIFGYRIRQSAMLQVSAKWSMQKRQHSNEKEKEKERGRRDIERECNQRNAGTANAASIAILSYFD